jgi:hypothetical protein
MAPLGSYELDSKTERMLLAGSPLDYVSFTRPAPAPIAEPTVFGFYCPAWCWSIPPMAVGLLAAFCGWGA